MDKQPLLNTYVSNVDMQEAIEGIEELIASGRKSYVVALNVDMVVKIEKDDYLKHIVDNADMVLVDGMPIVWISKWYKRPVKEKVSGSDLVPRFCGVAAEKGYSIFIIGGKEGVAEKAKDNLLIKYPSLKVVGTYSPVFGFERNIEEIGLINKIISDAKPDIVITCLGCPKQEKWIYENMNNYDAKVSICAGATVDFIAGNVKRAPKWMSDHGLEWFYRMLKEPNRLVKRYLIDDVKIVKLFFKYI